MSRFNNFGAIYTDVLAMYPGTVLADYDGGGENGQTVIEATLGRISREVSSAFTPEVYKQLTQVDCEQVVRYATDGQTTATLGLVPTIAGTVHLWAYPSLASQELRATGENGTPYEETSYRKPVVGYGELAGYSVTASTGAITGIPSLGIGQRLYASYDVDVDDEDFALPSVADIVLLGAASELGARLYSDGTQEWKLVEDYRNRYRGQFIVPGSEQGQVGRTFAGTIVPDELRKLNYWTEVESKSESGVSSVRLYRG